MTIVKFDYLAPNTIEETINIILKNDNKKIAIMAGGTDLMVKIHQKRISPQMIISLKKIKNLNKINFDPKKGLTIGATVLLSTIANDKKILKYYPTISMAAKSTANVQIRNMGTIVGNLCNASPSADNAPILLAMKAILNITGPNGKKKIKLEDFFIGPSLTKLTKGEVVTSVFIPKPPLSFGTSYHSISQRSQIDCSAVGAATMIVIKKNKIDDIRLFISACAPTPLRAIKAEKILRGNLINNDLIKKASYEAIKEMAPISDIRASEKYRKKMIGVISSRAIKDAIKMASN